MNVPSYDECISILEEQHVPSNIIAHTKKVCEVALRVCDVVSSRGISVNRELVQAGALLHDVKKLEEKHEMVGADFVTSLGYTEVGDVIRTHGLANLKIHGMRPATIEQKIVFYADKRVKNDEVVGISERFKDIRDRYPGFDAAGEEEKTAQDIEDELLEGQEIVI